ncbi:MAG TPA: hypothetical protein ENJ32_11605, partial [Crenotrichaceae bacterium]|nr:hypothetical protein [Crenotrichaceae bacterium]
MKNIISILSLILFISVSNAQAVETDAPTALSPRGIITTNQPVFSWTAVTGTKAYVLYSVDASGEIAIWKFVGANQAGCLAGIGTCSYFDSSATFAEGAGGFWYVSTFNQRWNSPASDTLEFTVDTKTSFPAPGIPVQLTPSGTIDTNTPTFNWLSVPGFTRYAIYAVDSTGEVKVNNIAECTTETCSYSKANAVFADGSATWEIRTEASDGTNGEWSDILDFTVDTSTTHQVTGAPTALSPSGTINTNQPTFTWTAVTGSHQYAVYAKDANGALKVWNVVGADRAGCGSGSGTCSYTHSTAIFAEGSGSFWKVMTTDDGYGPDSNILEFTVDTTGTADRCDMSIDTDQDRLPDCVETNTGIYVNPLNTGTDPAKVDTDDDALSDGDEVKGTIGGLDLPGMGVSPVHKDLLVEYDWIDDAIDCGFEHTHRPSQAIVNRVSAGFSAAPADLINNPDGQPGINVIHDYGQGGLFTGGNAIEDDDHEIDGIPDRNTQQNGIYFEVVKDENFNANRRGYFHRVLMGHFLRNSQGGIISGISELPGDDTIVSIGCGPANFFPGDFVTFDEIAANTIMHELGHNLGLRHGGGQFL